LPPSFHGWMKKKVGNMFSFFGICFHLTWSSYLANSCVCFCFQYDAYVACIDENVSRSCFVRSKSAGIVTDATFVYRFQKRTVISWS
jgi:hypothetical protein